MQAITYTEARQNLAGTMSKVAEDFEPILITRSKGGNCVLMSYEQYCSLEETAYLMRLPTNAKRLLDSVAELRQGQGIERELIE